MVDHTKNKSPEIIEAEMRGFHAAVKCVIEHDKEAVLGAVADVIHSEPNPSEVKDALLDNLFAFIRVASGVMGRKASELFGSEEWAMYCASHMTDEDAEAIYAMIEERKARKQKH